MARSWLRVAIEQLRSLTPRPETKPGKIALAFVWLDVVPLIECLLGIHFLSVLADDTALQAGDLYIRSITFSPDCKLLATGAEDRLVRVSRLEFAHVSVYSMRLTMHCIPRRRSGTSPKKESARYSEAISRKSTRSSFPQMAVSSSRALVIKALAYGTL
jgi:WD40 repeat protein